MDIYNKLAKKTGDTAKTIAQKMAKTAREETENFAKSASSQVTGNENQTVNTNYQTSPIVEVMQQGTQSVSDTQHQNIHNEEKKRLDYLQKELEELRRKRKLEEQQKQMHEAQMQTQGEKSLPPLIEPTTKPKRGGRMSIIQKKQRKTEIGRGAKG